MSTLNKTILMSSCVALCLGVSGCQSISKTKTKVGSWFGKDSSVPQVDAKGIVDISKTTLNQIEQFTETMPKDQWVYMKNKKEEVYTIQNKSQDNNLLSFRLNCQISTQKPTFYLYNAKGEQILTAYDPKAGQIQFLLDNTNFGNPFSLYTTKQLDHFRKALAAAKTIKIYNAGTLYTFENQHAELLEKPVSCSE